MPTDGRWDFNHLNAKLNPICHLLVLLGDHRIFHVSGLRVNSAFKGLRLLPGPWKGQTQVRGPEA